jgi:hypothetical protein
MNEESLDAITGMEKMFCGAIRPEAEKANSNFWTLAEAVNGEKPKGKIPSARDVMESMMTISQSADVASSVSLEPARSWLKDLSASSGEVVRWFGNGTGSTEELMYAVGGWKEAFEQLSTYCP